MDYYSILIRNEPSRHEKICRNHKGILLSEIDQSKRAMSVYGCMIPTIWHFGKGKTTDSKITSGCQGLGRDE